MLNDNIQTLNCFPISMKPTLKCKFLFKTHIVGISSIIVNADTMGIRSILNRKNIISAPPTTRIMIHSTWLWQYILAYICCCWLMLIAMLESKWDPPEPINGESICDIVFEALSKWLDTSWIVCVRSILFCRFQKYLWCQLINTLSTKLVQNKIICMKHVLIVILFVFNVILCLICIHRQHVNIIININIDININK